jgi:hypothetical protein
MGRLSPSVLDDGQITELGTHEDLLAANNGYAKLFELQAIGYRYLHLICEIIKQDEIEIKKF